MAKLRVSSSYNLIMVASTFSPLFGLGKRKMSSYAASRSGILGEISYKRPNGRLLTNVNQYSETGRKSSLAKERKTVKVEWGDQEAEKLIIHFDDNIMETIKGYDSILVLFHTTWCDHCKSLKIAYGKAAIRMAKENIPGRLGAIDVTKRMEIADLFNIVAIPILKYFRKGEFIAVYRNNRTADEIVNFMKNTPEKSLIMPKIDI